ncbi:unnamed protein product [Brugia timori]|uniref:Uncharacterized protein n=1 Tax=Brugia timori TaxID=42155 RepID=A0A0R3QA07_9BILA|nr:unnamed protein product [Brugia timori]
MSLDSEQDDQKKQKEQMGMILEELPENLIRFGYFVFSFCLLI